MALSDEQNRKHRGHPTSPGGRTEDVDDHGQLVRPTRTSQGPGIPGNSSSGPMQPGAERVENQDASLSAMLQLIAKWTR